MKLRLEELQDKVRILEIKAAAYESMRNALLEETKSLRTRIKELEEDAFVMSLRLLGEDDDTFSPECFGVMKKWKPIAMGAIKNASQYLNARRTNEHQFSKPTDRKATEEAGENFRAGEVHRGGG